MTTSRYAPISIILHWTMLLLIGAVYAAIELRTFFPRGSDLRNGFKTWHFMLGLAVLTLVAVRLLARFALPVPAPLSPRPPPWQTIASRLTHVALYALMIGMPLAGWATLSAQGTPVPYFGLVLPPLISPDAALGDWIQEIHETAGTVGYWLIALHASAALFHHYWLRDDTLGRMLPRRS